MRPRPEFTIGPLVARWIEANCVHGPGDILGRPVKLRDDEKRFLAWAYEIDADGNRLVRRGVRGLPKGSRKTEFAAWIAIAEFCGPVRFDRWREDGKPLARRTRDPYVVAAASTYEQADVLYSAITAAINEGPLKQFAECFDREILLSEESGKIVRVPAVTGANDGLRPTFVVADETHEWVAGKSRVHLVLENGLAKRADAWSLSITTAGNPKVESVALSHYERGRLITNGELEDPGFLFDWREPDVNVDDLSDEEILEKAIRQANPEPWKRLDDIKRRFHEIPLHEFCRYHLNMWVEPDEERWLPPGSWVTCESDRVLQPKERIVLGFDGSYSGDSTALVAATVEEQPHLVVLGLWEHPGGNAQWEVPIDEVDAAVIKAFNDFTVVEMAADPPYWSQQIQRWSELYGSEVVLAFQTYVRKRMSQACSAFYQAVTTGGITHDGDPGLDRHIHNAVLKETAQGAYITKESKSTPRKIDAAIAAVIAHSRATWHYANPIKKPRAELFT